MTCKCGSKFLPLFKKQKKCYVCLVIDECKKTRNIENSDKLVQKKHILIVRKKGKI